MTDPAPIFDPAAWVERFVRFGGQTGSRGVERPLAASLPVGELTWRQRQLGAMFNGLGPYRWPMVHAWVRENYWRVGPAQRWA